MDANKTYGEKAWRQLIRMLRAILNKSWGEHPTKHQLYSHLPPITKTIKVRRTRHAWHCWRSRDELISDVLLWTPSYGRAKAGRPARTYKQQLCEDTECSPEKRWTIGRSGEGESGISVLAALHHDDDDDIKRGTLSLYITICFFFRWFKFVQNLFCNNYWHNQ